MFRITFRIPKTDIDIVTEKLFAIHALSVSVTGESVSEEKYRNIDLLAHNKGDEEAAQLNSSEISVLTALFENIEPVMKYFAENKYICEEVKDEDWKYRWMEYLSDFEICPGITISPETNTGSSVLQHDESVRIKLDPRDAFGDGKHPTTSMCAEILAGLMNLPETDKSETAMLDAGTGTGILAIIASKLGIRDITAFDIEEDSVRMARKNALMNQCGDINFLREDIKRFSTDKKYNIITANLLTAVIEENIGKLADLLVPGGYLIVSGISDTWDNSIRSVFKNKNLEIINNISCNGWMCYLLTH